MLLTKIAKVTSGVILKTSLIFRLVKVDKSVYIAKSSQRFPITLNNLFVARAKEN